MSLRQRQDFGWVQLSFRTLAEGKFTISSEASAVNVGIVCKLTVVLSDTSETARDVVGSSHRRR